MKSIFTALVLMAVGATLAVLYFKLNISSSGLIGNRESVSVILTGFGSQNQDGVWEGEAAPFINALDQEKDISDKVPMCQNAFEGYLYKNKVLVAISGMAKVRTTACLSDILNYYHGRVKEVIVAGVAGITPAAGGNGEAAMIGDVCINSLAYDFDLQHYSSDLAGTDQSQPVFWTQESNFVSQATSGNQELARELYRAASGVVQPAIPQNVADINVLYHQTGRSPKIWGPEKCMEVTSDLYWHDIKADARARELAAGYMQQVYGINVKPDSIVVVTSMEAVPAGVLVDWWNKAKSTNIAFAYVRGASNFDRVYLNSGNTPATEGRGSLEQFKISGLSQYAIQTATLPVLKMFELRNVSSR
jgi:purine nucleoside permease